MTTTIEPVSRPRRASIVLGALALGLFLGFAGLAFFAHRATTGLWSRLATELTGRSIVIDTSAPVIVEKIQRLARLETVVYTTDQTVEGQRQGRLLPPILTGDKIMMLVHGQAVAGVDLAQLRTANLAIDKGTVFVHLPDAQIFSTSIDSAHSRVFNRETGWLVNPDPSLESEVRTSAEQQIRAAALKDGILIQAQNNARTAITALLTGLGFTRVQFV